MNPFSYYPDNFLNNRKNKDEKHLFLKELE